MTHFSFFLAWEKKWFVLSFLSDLYPYFTFPLPFDTVKSVLEFDKMFIYRVSQKITPNFEA